MVAPEVLEVAATRGETGVVATGDQAVLGVAVYHGVPAGATVRLTLGAKVAGVVDMAMVASAVGAEELTGEAQEVQVALVVAAPEAEETTEALEEETLLAAVAQAVEVLPTGVTRPLPT
tara:strand:+ start:50863 stop:51219 length:357 start_codon:yes stop_codon:yes gene_type:complete